MQPIADNIADYLGPATLTNSILIGRDDLLIVGLMTQVVHVNGVIFCYQLLVNVGVFAVVTAYEHRLAQMDLKSVHFADVFAVGTKTPFTQQADLETLVQV